MPSYTRIEYNYVANKKQPNIQTIKADIWIECKLPFVYVESSMKLSKITANLKTRGNKN